MLNRLRVLSESRDYAMGLAPSTSVARTLERESGIESETVQRFLTRHEGIVEGRGTAKGLRTLRASFSKTVLEARYRHRTERGHFTDFRPLLGLPGCRHHSRALHLDRLPPTYPIGARESLTYSGPYAPYSCARRNARDHVPCRAPTWPSTPVTGVFCAAFGCRNHLGERRHR